MRFFPLVFLALLALPAEAWAQSANVVATCGTPNQTYTVGTTVTPTMNQQGTLCTVGGSGTSGAIGSAGTNGTTAQSIQGITGGVPVPVSGSFSISGFTPTSTYGTPLVLNTGASSSGTLPAGTVVIFQNVGANPAYINLGATAATTAMTYVPAGEQVSLTVGANTAFTGISTGGATTINTSGGSGLFTGAGGGGSSSGGAVTLNATPTLANGNGVVPTELGAVLSATNGSYTNVLQGNAVLSVTNGLYTNLLQGNAVISNTNPLPINNQQLGGTALGAPSNYGTSPGAVAVAGVNADVTNTVAANLTQVAGTVLGVASNYGTSPGAVEVQGVNAFVTNTAGMNLAQLNGVALGSGSNYGTSPGAVAVQGVNAYVTATAPPTPNATAGIGITPIISGSASSGVVLKAGAGNLYGAYANCTSACWLMIFNQTSAPSNGATTAGTAANGMQDCIPIAAGGQNFISYMPGPPEVFSTGIYAAISSTACGTLTLSSVGYIHGSIE